MADQLAEAVARSQAVEEIRVGNGVLGEAGDMIRRYFTGDTVLVVADENTIAAAGAPLIDALKAAGFTVRQHILPAKPRPKPSVELGEIIAADIGDAIPVAVGSGVINDVTKYAAFITDRRYFVVPTAASMDGYASAGAPLSQGGFKKTIPTRAPIAILADMDVVAAAPAEMSGWGYGDTAGKVPAGADWIIADALGIEPIDDVAWPLVQGNLALWLSAPEAVRRGEPAAISDLFAGLNLSGLAMEFHGSSRPASGADHQIAHMWEMEGLEWNGERVSHGACVSVGCLTALALMDWLIAQDLSVLDADAIVAAAPSIEDKRREIASLMSPALAERADVETLAKHLGQAEHRERLATVAAAWPTLRDRLKRDVMRAPAMAEKLKAAGAPVRSEDIAVDRAHLRRTIRAARFIRSRYTVLDLLEECGLLDAAIDAVAPAEA